MRLDRDKTKIPFYWSKLRHWTCFSGFGLGKCQHKIDSIDFAAFHSQPTGEDWWRRIRRFQEPMAGRLCDGSITPLQPMGLSASLPLGRSPASCVHKSKGFKRNAQWAQREQHNCRAHGWNGVWNVRMWPDDMMQWLSVVTSGHSLHLCCSKGLTPPPPSPSACLWRYMQLCTRH